VCAASYVTVLQQLVGDLKKQTVWRPAVLIRAQLQCEYGRHASLVSAAASPNNGGGSSLSVAVACDTGV
jgi:hypothetical protein